MAPNRILKFYRIQDGVRVPYVMELDAELTVVSEYADTTHLQHVVDGRRSPGARRVEDENPERRKSMIIARWVSESVAENPIEGTDEIRDSYFEDLRALRDKHIERGSRCKPCDVGKLMRRYREILEEKGYLGQL